MCFMDLYCIIFGKQNYASFTIKFVARHDNLRFHCLRTIKAAMSLLCFLL